MDVPDDLRRVRPARTATELSSFRGQLSDKLDLVREQLAQTSESDVAKLPERIFVNVFLPLFAGDEKLLYEAKIYPHWINVAGNPYRPVDVIDVRGNVLFRVPPVLDRTRVSTSTQTQKEGPRGSISHMVASAQQYAGMSPVLGERYLSKQFTERALLMKVPHSVLQDLETWNAIFERYGRPPLHALPKDGTSDATGKDSSETSSNGGVEIEFE